MIHFTGIFPYKSSSYWGIPILGNLQIAGVDVHIDILQRSQYYK